MDFRKKIGIPKIAKKTEGKIKSNSKTSLLRWLASKTGGIKTAGKEGKEKLSGSLCRKTGNKGEGWGSLRRQ